ncbi:hypothetical protein [Euzebyella saccharophila]|uniref:Uncharacterized protein n=1 Tax=Euzebyella saccharophila TaxID=679664 RepID=A0ABV8JRX6_9FLAO|nr:hypothetical protein [Euzebyella saccharophila]
MESCMVANWAEDNNKIIRKYFEDNFPNFQLLEENVHGPYWGIKYMKDDLIINIKGDIGFYIEIIIDGKPYDLWRYDKKVNNHTKSNPENITAQLAILSDFLK